MKPAVYLLPVPLSDSSPSAVLPAYNVEVLRDISTFVVENVRTARRFLKKIDKSFNIDALSFHELNEHTDDSTIPALLEPIMQGRPIGVMSEAGCPAVADPGAKLVRLAQQRSIPVIPLVGPSSILLALMASGMNGQNFTFNGYLPIEEKAREKAIRSMLANVVQHNVTQIFIETPYRNNKLVSRLISVLPPDINLCVASDITGPDESIITRPVRIWKKTAFDYDRKPAIFLLGN